MADTATLVLTVTVTYDLAEGGTISQAVEQLESIPEFLAGMGMLSGETDLAVEDYTSVVTVKSLT